MGRKQRQRSSPHKKESPAVSSQRQNSSHGGPHLNEAQERLRREYQNGNHPLDFQRFVDSMCDLGMSDNSQRLFAGLTTNHSLDAQRSMIRELLIESETDVELNDSQPLDDGDQSTPPTEGKGADIEHCMIWNAFPPFVRHVVRGDAARVRTILKQQHAVSSSLAFRQLLELRCSSLRLSPLVLCVAIQKHPHIILTHNRDLQSKDQLDHVGVAAALLRYGARPDAKDVTGKTIVHYGAGGMATPESFVIVEYCIAAARVSAYNGQTVIVDGLQAKPELNQSSVVLTGFDGPTGRCVVQLEEEDGSKRECRSNHTTCFSRSEDLVLKMETENWWTIEIAPE